MKQFRKYLVMILFIFGCVTTITSTSIAASEWLVEEGETYTFNFYFEVNETDPIEGAVTVTIDKINPDGSLEYSWVFDEEAKSITAADMVRLYGGEEEDWVDYLPFDGNEVKTSHIPPGWVAIIFVQLVHDYFNFDNEFTLISKIDEDSEYPDEREFTMEYTDDDGTKIEISERMSFDLSKGVLLEAYGEYSFKNKTSGEEESEIYFIGTDNGPGSIPSYPAVFVGLLSLCTVVMIIKRNKQSLK